MKDHTVKTYTTYVDYYGTWSIDLESDWDHGTLIIKWYTDTSHGEQVMTNYYPFTWKSCYQPCPNGH